jgi:hypothetical protein
MSEKDEPMQTESRPPAPKKPSKVWSRNFYIRGYGKVEKGEKATKKQLDAWKSITDVKPKIENVTNISTESSK